MALIDDILALPSALRATQDTQAIADALSAGRVRVVTKEVGDGLISLALGMPAGPVFLSQLETMAGMTLAADATPEAIAQHAMVRQAWRSISKAAFDVGNPAVRVGIDLFVGLLLTAEQATAIKALAEQPDPVSEMDVRRACWSDEGVWQA